jgi:hypothetical protein
LIEPPEKERARKAEAFVGHWSFLIISHFSLQAHEEGKKPHALASEHSLTSGFEAAANATGADAERVDGQTESFGQRPAILDLGSLLSVVIAQNQLAILGLQALQTTFKVIQALLSFFR